MGKRDRTVSLEPLPAFLQGFAASPAWEAGHDPQSCADPCCDRLACRGYRLGYQKGFQDGFGAGYAAGYAAGCATAAGGSR